MENQTPSSEKALLEKWQKRLRESQFSHYVAARVYEQYNYLLGVPVVILSTLVGTSVFATLGKSVNTSIQISVGLTSVLAAVLASIQTFFRFSERAEKHRAVAARYGSLRREVEQHLSVQRHELTNEGIASLRSRIDKLAEEAPNVSARIWSKTKKEIRQES